MLAAKQIFILREVEEGTGATIGLEEDRSGMQTGLRLWFADLPRSHSPIVTLQPAGLHRFRATLTFGNFAADTISQMNRADAEEVDLARALVASVAESATVRFAGEQSLESWRINDGRFLLTAEKTNIKERYEDDALAATCRELVIPILAAMAELYGYDSIEEPIDQAGEIEGALSISVISRRERNPRNRLLSLRIHGGQCKICGFDPAQRYPDLRSIIEVHHIQPLSSLGEPRAYDPSKDLIPLCPNCHRAAHTRRPLPWSPDELRLMHHD
ncbi:5-methylcytosine-specific restriction protein A [Hoeflea marina]|uniref:5-methylcytosine-specific restriction protein A n=1 Tax=Hoeflea marina TaxID=274592 RepID=A0A317PIT0_9HYPH|nr:HNH endonuclease [Hoeflea marina]PWW00352.1 5-methylcytosine-specific restriction protein A [Hoeflea marina]